MLPWYPLTQFTLLDVMGSHSHRQYMRLRCRPFCFLPVLLCILFLVILPKKLSAQDLRDIPPSRPANTHLPIPANQSLRSLFLVGDSEVSSGPGGTSAASQGWGEPLASFFDPGKLNVVNRAVTSSSSRAYVVEGYWADTLMLLKPGDVVLIQFGQHEGGSPAASVPEKLLPVESTLPGIADDFREITNPSSRQHELVHSYGWYLRQLVVDTIAHGATPVLCSPIPHRDWQAGHIRQSPESYAGWAKAIAIQQRIQFLDLNAILAASYDGLGETAAALLFTSPGDNTNAAGAEQNARLLIGALKGLNPDPLRGYFAEKATAIPAIAPPPPMPSSQPAPSLQPVF